MSALSIRQKLSVLVGAIALIFILALLVIRSNVGSMATIFDDFYQQNFSLSLQAQRLKEAQVQVMVDVRGLQIAYLLNLDDQVPGYLTSMDSQYRQLPLLLAELEQQLADSPSQYRQLSTLVNNYQRRSQAFVQAMQTNANHAAPFAVFSAFMDSYAQTQAFIDDFIEQADLAAQQARTQAEQTVVQANRMFVLSTALALAAAVLLTLVLAKNMVSSIKSARDIMAAVEGGDLQLRLALAGSDELAQLGRSLNRSLDQLCQALKQSKSAAQQVESKSDQVSGANEQIRTLCGQVTDSTHQIVSAMEEMSSTSKAIAENTNQTAQATGDMQKLVNQGLVDGQQGLVTVEKLVQTLDGSAKVVGQLQQETTNIEKILDVIRAIAEQTNLLALNAAIEAARAGDQGRGFAVVADEVRTLAQRSQSSVNEIETLLNQLRHAGQEAVTHMSSSSGMADSSREQFQHSVDRLQQMLAQVVLINDQTQQIATAAEQQSSVATEISDNLHRVQALSNQTTDRANSTSQASAEMKQLGHGISSALAFFKLANP